jgi:hypothetical protein
LQHCSIASTPTSLHCTATLIQELMASQAQRIILQSLADKFGKVPPHLEEQVRAIQDRERLEQLNSWVARCPDLPTFAGHLSTESGRLL